MARSKTMTMAILGADIRSKIKQLGGLKARAEENDASALSVKAESDRLDRRRAELLARVDAITAETSMDARCALERDIDEYCADADNLDRLRSEGKEIAELERAIAKLQAELDALENEDSGSGESYFTVNDDDEGNGDQMDGRNGNFGLTRRDRVTLVGIPEVKRFLDSVRAVSGGGGLIPQGGVFGGDLAIPNIMLGIIRENISLYSKLISRIRVMPADGKSRAILTTGVPEAVWMEMIANYNELAFALYDVEVDGYAVGGFLPLSNISIASMSQTELVMEIMTMLAAAIGLALDKALIYGTGVKMPLGIVTRLAQTAQPSAYPATARAWADLHTSNILTVRGGAAPDYTELTGIQLYRGLACAAGHANDCKIADGDTFWAMSKNTWIKLVGSAALLGSDRDITSMRLPAIGGDVLILDFIPDGQIVGGYGDCYLLAERGGMTFAQSDQARLLNGQTVFAGEARYDGVPVIAEAFVAIAIDGGEVDTSIEFASDAANA